MQDSAIATTPNLPNLHMLGAVREELIPAESSLAVRIALLVAATSICWLQLPRAFGGEAPIYLLGLSIAPLLIGIVVLTPSITRSRSKMRPLAVGLSVLVLVFVLSLYRSALAGSVGSVASASYTAAAITLVTTFGLMLFRSGLSRRQYQKRAVAVALAPGIFVCLNVFIHVAAPGVFPLAGEFVVEPTSPAQLLGFLGIGIERVRFPLVEGINTFGVIAGAGFAGASLVTLGRFSRRSRALAGAVASISLIGILLADSRASLVFSVAAVFVAHILLDPVRRKKGAALVASAAVLVGLVAIGIFTGGDAAESLSRTSGESDLLTATNRTVIWGAVLEELSDPQSQHLVGFGIAGQVDSGVSLRYAYLFSYLPDPTLTSAHNFLLQAILDIGYLGLILLGLVTLGALSWLVRGTRAPIAGAEALTGAFILFLLNGLTEAFPSNYAPATMFPFLLLACGAIGLSAANSPLHQSEPSLPSSVGTRRGRNRDRTL